MAKVHLDRLKKRYGAEPVKGANYSEIVKQILDSNTQNVSNKMNRLSVDKWEKLGRKVMIQEKRLVMPDLTEIVPPRALSVAKAAQNGELIRDTLRDALTRDLRQTLDEFHITGDEAYIRRRGITAGRINPELANDFKRRINNTFSGYTKKDPKLGMPSNVHNIAVTEVRRSINTTKKQFVDKVLAKNPDISARKKWIHNNSLSFEPRRGHIEVDGRMVEPNEPFLVPLYKTIKGKLKKVGVTQMQHPHDNNAPAEQVIGCNCDYDIIVTRKRKAKLPMQRKSYG
jgi:hypothetical protein